MWGVPLMAVLKAHYAIHLFGQSVHLYSRAYCRIGIFSGIQTDFTVTHFYVMRYDWI